MFFIVLFFLFSLCLIAGPFVLPLLLPAIKIGMMAKAIMTGSGVVLASALGFILVYLKIYVNVSASEALVITGRSGRKRIIKDGGTTVIPILDKVIRLSLEPITVVVVREGANALLTGDSLRADINAKFIIRIEPDDESIQTAARTFGSNPKKDHIEAFAMDILDSALRSVATKKTLAELNSDRDSFLRSVTETVHLDLKHNGLTLKTPTISKLDQAKYSDAEEVTNVFDAQGRQTVAAIIEHAKIERNRIVRTAEQQRKEQDVLTQKQILALNQQQKEAEAQQETALAKISAEQNRVTKEANIAAERSIQIATIEQQKTLEVAGFEKQKAAEVADRQRQQAVEVAERQKLQAIADADAKKAEADAKSAIEEAKAEKARQEIKTVTVVADAERKKQTMIIDAEADAKKKLTLAQQEAEAKAFGIERDAKARMTAADADATAITKSAEAKASAATKTAEGEKAQQLVAVEVAARQVEVDKKRSMIPVDVKLAEVDVAQKQVDVLKQELQARQENGAVAQEFELAKLAITSQTTIQIETAKATATLAGSINAQVFGTSEDVSKMLDRFNLGLGAANLLSGFNAGADSKTSGLLGAALNKAGQLLNQATSGTTPETSSKPIEEGSQPQE